MITPAENCAIIGQHRVKCAGLELILGISDHGTSVTQNKDAVAAGSPLAAQIISAERTPSG